MDEIEQALAGLFEYLQNTPMGAAEQQALMGVLGELNDLINAPIEAELPTSAGLLWHISGGNVNAFRDYMSQVPDPALNRLASSPVQMMQVIQRLQQNQPQERNREIDGIPQAPLQSSNIWGFQYDPRSRKLWVRFQGDGIYEYQGVDPKDFSVFKAGAVPAKTEGKNNFGFWYRGKNPSLGSAFYEMIRKKGYAFQKVA